jgi:oligoribonuclease NrnB/cAMP/cGMP phosphodiesterase (DHH superfamily)
MAEFIRQDKVGYTNNEKMLDELFDLKKALKIFLFQNDLNNAYLALVILISECEGGLIRTMGAKFNQDFYDSKKEELNKLMRDFNNENLPDENRLKVLSNVKLLMLEIYTKLNKDLWQSSIIFKLEEGFNPKDLTGK